MTYWKDRSVLVTGGSAGLGLAIAVAFARSGAKVAIVGRNQERLQVALQKLQALSPQCIAIVADLTLADDAARMVRETVNAFSGLHVLVNNAGVSMRGDILSTPVEDFRRLLELNFLALVRCTQLAAPALITSRGHIINIGSLASKSAARYLGAYPASKFPVAALSQQLRMELGPQGVSTLLVCPGPLKRDDAGERYQEQAAKLPAQAQRPGGGVKLKGIDPDWLAARILKAAERRKAELVVPFRAKLLFALSQLFPTLGDWLIERSTSG